MSYTFNGNYNDLEQVAQFIGDFAKVHAEIITSGQYPYNASFRGRIPGDFNRESRRNVEGDHEDAAIYLLQGLLRAWEQEAKITDLLAEGYECLEALDDEERFANVVLHPTRHRMGGEWAEYESARVVPEDGRPHGVLPKGKRTRGYLVAGRRVLVRRAA